MTDLILQRVTFTGADDATDVERLETLARAHPWIEFGVLVSPTRTGRERYPSTDWRARFLASAIPLEQRAFHLCGAAVDQFLAADEALYRELDRVSRVQLNFEVTRFPLDDVARLRMLFHQWEQFAPDTQFILQFNAANAYLPELITGPGAPLPNVSFLADSSGGRGVVPRSWPAPVPGYFTAYAGGMGPGTMATTLAQLERVTSVTAIDMETRLRTHDQFDLERVERTIQELLSLCDPSVLPDGRPALVCRAPAVPSV
jgi:hypothetical protein